MSIIEYDLPTEIQELHEWIQLIIWKYCPNVRIHQATILPDICTSEKGFTVAINNSITLHEAMHTVPIALQLVGV